MNLDCSFNSADRRLGKFLSMVGNSGANFSRIFSDLLRFLVIWTALQ
jgi:hypothetical protein